MTPFVFSRGPEPRYKSGDLKLTVNQIALLLALRTFPHGRAPSLAAWFPVALRIKARFGDARSLTALRDALVHLNRDWLTGDRRGGRWIMCLSARGADIAEGRVPVRIVGHGPWRGLQPERIPLVLRANVGRSPYLPSLHVPGIDLDWRPDEYPRDFIEIARLTAPSIGLALSYCARRVGRSWHLRVERFPQQDPHVQLPRRFAVRPLSLRQLAALIDGTHVDYVSQMAQPGVTLIDHLFDRHAYRLTRDPKRLRDFVRVTSACYPELERLYAGRVENRVRAFTAIMRTLTQHRAA